MTSEDPGLVGTSAQAGNEADPEKNRRDGNCRGWLIKAGFPHLCTTVSGAVSSLGTCCSLNSSSSPEGHMNGSPFMTLCSDKRPAVHCSSSELNNLFWKHVLYMTCEMEENRNIATVN